MRGYALCACLVLGAWPAAAEAPARSIPSPADAQLLFTAEAAGVQIYRSADTGGALHWELEAPLARLTGQDGRVTIYHYAGPSWEAADGSKLMRDPAVAVLSEPAADPADIPALLITVAADPAAGILADVAYVERLATHGGAAPSTPPVRPGTRIGVPYTATYAFFSKADPTGEANR